MKTDALQKLINSGRYYLPWWTWLIHGSLIIFIGMSMATASVLNPDISILTARDFSLLPICGLFIVVLGMIECLDALFAREVCDFMQRMNTGVLDSVFGSLIILGISATPESLSSVIALYLLVSSILGAIFSWKLKIPYLNVSLMVCFLSFSLGISLIYNSFEQASWYYSLCLSTQIFLRGLILIFYALFIKKTLPIS